MSTNGFLLALEKAVTPLFAKILANDDEPRILTELRDLLLPKRMSGEIHIQDAKTFVGAVL